MKNKLVLTCMMILTIQSCMEANKVETNSTTTKETITTKIAFGSCGEQVHPQPILNNIVEHQPDLFVYLGDNIYGDTDNMDTLKAKYKRLANKESFKNLKRHIPIIATWDDHDYGWDNVGKFHPRKKESEEIFLDFFEEPDSSSRRQHEGIYHSYMYEYGENKLQIILLDVRYFRDDIKPYNGEFDHDERYDFYYKQYTPHTDSTTTMLGKEQWNWLKQELKTPADIRIIGSGTQFGVEWNGWESWANFPHEIKRMNDLIKSTKANGVIFISGDIHYSELSKLDTDFYPIYDFTSSGLSNTYDYAAPNKNRIEGPVMDNHFGLISIDWNGENTVINMENWDVRDNQRFQYSVELKDLQFKE